MISHSVMKGLRRTYSPYAYVFRRPLEDVLIKTNILILLRRRLQDLDVFQKHLQDVLQKRLQGIFKISSRRFEDVFKMLREILQNSQQNISAEISFCYLVNFAKFFVRTPFFQNSSGWLLLIIAVLTVAKGILANETVNYDTKTKALSQKLSY